MTNEQNQEDQIEQYQELDEQVLKDNQLPDFVLNSIEKQKVIDQEIKLAYKLYGMQYNQTPKLGFIATQIFAQSKIPENFILSHFLKIFYGTLHSLASSDSEFLSEYLEPSLCSLLLSQISHLSSLSYRLCVSTDHSGLQGEPVLENSMICDMTVVRGLSVNREENRPEEWYHRFVDDEDMGLVIYTPLEVRDEQYFVQKKDSDKVYDLYKKVVLRILVEVQSPVRLQVFRPDGEEIKVDNQDYLWRHLLLFESQLKEPSKFSKNVQSENYMEWLTKFKPGVWKLVDIDNVMQGNPLIKGKQNNKYSDEVFKGSKYDPESYIDIKKVS